MRIILFLLLFSCASPTLIESAQEQDANSLATFKMMDSNGEYIVKRDIKQANGRFISRLQYLGKDGVTLLENTVAVSRIGSIKNEIAILPEASQYRVWFDKEEYFSQIKIDPKSRKAQVRLKNKNPRWKGAKSFDLPRARYICFFSQLPECLKKQKLLIKSARKKLSLYVIWDNFPYQQDLYTGLGDDLVSLASLSVSDHNSKEFKFSLDVGSQILFFHYDKNLDFTKMFWVAQGISMIKVGEE